MSNSIKRRPVNGILLLDKPIGLSSNQALQKVKRLFGAEKAGHTGSLDPLATGMLPICFGEATKFSTQLLAADKQYQAIAQLGSTTTTGDAEGEITAEQPIPAITAERLQELVKQFTGAITQLPPMYSALKHQGQPLYRLARQGLSIERKRRTVQIYSLSLASLSASQLSLTVHCSKGTYIRTLVEDIGNAIGCGAHVQQLHRTWVQPFQPQHMMTLAELQSLHDITGYQGLDSKLLPADTAIQDYACCEVSQGELMSLFQGQSIRLNDNPGLGFVRIYCQEIFAGLGEVESNNQLYARRMLKKESIIHLLPCFSC